MTGSETEQGGRRNKGTPTWLHYIPGVLAGSWMAVWIGYVFWTKVLSPGLTVLGKAVISAICATGVAFLAIVFMPVKGESDVEPSEGGNFWVFLRTPAPAEPARYALWLKFRRTLAILLLALVLMMAWGVVISLGLAKVQ